jgi:hypothetical protein
MNHQRKQRITAGVLMHDSVRPVGRYSLCSLFAAVVVAAVALSPSAYADDDDLFSPTGPSIVVGGTVHPPAAIVVDPETPTAATGPIDPTKPIGVDPRVRVAVPTCCSTSLVDINNGKRWMIPDWPPPWVKPPVFVVQKRDEDTRTAYLDNHGRYWLMDHKTEKFEQVGGWPAPLPTNPSDQGQPGPLYRPGSIGAPPKIS